MLPVFVILVPFVLLCCAMFLFSRSFSFSHPVSYLQNLMNELEVRESQFNAVVARGTALHMDAHPASAIIQTYVAALEAQWAWLLQLTHCLETHLEHTAHYKQFFKEAKHCDEWLDEQSNRLNSYFLRTEGIPVVDEGEKLIREIQVSTCMTNYLKIEVPSRPRSYPLSL